MKQFTTNPGVGWIKANGFVGPEVLTELSRLSKENSNLREEINNLNEKIEIDEVTKNDKIISTLNNHKETLSFFYENGKDWEDDKEIDFLEIFTRIAPELMVEKSTEGIVEYIAFLKKPKKDRNLRISHPIPSNIMQAILADLVVLGLIKPSDKKHSLKDTNEYWAITEEGKDVYKAIRRKIIESKDFNLSNFDVNKDSDRNNEEKKQAPQ